MARKAKEPERDDMENVSEEKLAEIGKKVMEGGLKGSQRTQDLVKKGHELEEEERR